MSDSSSDDELSLASPRMPDFAKPTAVGSRCPVEATLDVLDRWKTLIVWHLFWGARPFCELMRTTEGISKKTLRWELAEMEKHGLVRREVRPGMNRKADYSLTPLGESLKPIVASMYQWGLSALRDPRNGAPRDPARLRPRKAAPRSPETERRAREFPEAVPMRAAWNS